jgi:hypothetical protein
MRRSLEKTTSLRSLRSRGRSTCTEIRKAAWPRSVPNFSFHSAFSHGSTECNEPASDARHCISSGQTATLRSQIHTPTPSGYARSSVHHAG